MTPSSRPAPLVAFAGVLGAGLLIGALGALSVKSCGPHLPVIPPLSSSVSVLRGAPNVLVAVQDLSRLESASFHMERVIDLTDKQSHLFGLIETEDAILLVAVADVSAGVDLQKLSKDDIRIDEAKRTVTLTLPAPELFHAELDNARTYVHTRRTGALANRQENLETRARQEAERTLVEAALQAGLLKRANENAKHAVEALVRGLGYESVEVDLREASAAAASTSAAGAAASVPSGAASGGEELR